ncbi:MAG: hypothetical protein B6D34_01315 [Candidatus Brocadia sp. UTAMX1]|jgi:hypothetical protein|nr:MAG: hypothetical protein B6D34_01315 [Candidatus Brocadia sp. UTAMX1]
MSIAGNVTAVVHSIRDTGGKYRYCKKHTNNGKTAQQLFSTIHKFTPFFMEKTQAINCLPIILCPYRDAKSTTLLSKD